MPKFYPQVQLMLEFSKKQLQHYYKISNNNKSQ